MSESLKSEILQHFDGLASSYDDYKARNAYYYQALKKVLRDAIPPDARSLVEIGCGTGDLLVSLAPERGLGLDLAPAMIERCRAKHQREGLSFEVGDAERLPDLAGYDAVFLADVVEHLADLEGAIRSLGQAMRPGGLLVLTWANHLWTPILDLAEKFGLKMPEGPHVWFSPQRLLGLLREQGFEVRLHETHLLCPMRLGGLGTWINKTLGRLPGLRRLGVIRVVGARKT